MLQTSVHLRIRDQFSSDFEGNRSSTDQYHHDILHSLYPPLFPAQASSPVPVSSPSSQSTACKLSLLLLLLLKARLLVAGIGFLI